MDEPLQTWEVEVSSTGGDAGDCYRFRCPTCRDWVTVGTFAWWVPTCECGRHWSVEVVATGESVSDE